MAASALAACASGQAGSPVSTAVPAASTMPATPTVPGVPTIAPTSTASLSAGATPTAAPTAAPPAPAASPAPGRLLGYAFNAASKDVTRFDVATRAALDTRPLGAVVTWLSNEQRFWDGRYIWTYDFPDNLVRAIAIDPRSATIARAIATRGRGPAHSLMLTPDLKTAWVNVAGDNLLAVVDVASGQVAGQVKTGAFP